MATPAIIDNDTWKKWQLVGRPAQLVDVRSATEFACGHLPGAINIPLDQIELRTADLDPTRPIVLVCQAGTRARLAAALLQPEFPNLTILDPGTGAWIRSGNPMVCCTVTRWALERQVRLVAGLLVLAGVILGVTVTPWFLGLAAFIGCGLTFAGATNICPMGELLARLPYNRLRRSGQKHFHSWYTPEPERRVDATSRERRPSRSSKGRGYCENAERSSDTDAALASSLSCPCEQQKQA